MTQTGPAGARETRILCIRSEQENDAGRMPSGGICIAGRNRGAGNIVTEFPIRLRASRIPPGRLAAHECLPEQPR